MHRWLLATVLLSSACSPPPPRVFELHQPLRIRPGGTLRNAVIKLADDFTGPAAIVVEGRAILRDLTINGNRSHLETRTGLPPYDRAFADFTPANGVLAVGIEGLTVEHVTFTDIAGFAVMINRSHNITLDRIEISHSGSRNPAGGNNTTGGILLEEGTTDFRVTNCDLRQIRGNGIWTHSLYTSPRNAHGIIRGNRFADVGRDAIQVGHATDVRVESNRGVRIGYPAEIVDAIPVGVDTAGNVDRSAYTNNSFEDMKGKCIDLDGFHDGEVVGNFCQDQANYAIVMNNTNPDMQSRNIRIADNTITGALFGGIFVIGTGHRITHNYLSNLNTAHCNEEAARTGCYYAPGEPDMLQSGIYLGRGAERPAPAHDNIVEDNTIRGYKMAARCIGVAPGLPPSANTIRNNRCGD